jgi:hypothetical protein
MYPAQRRRGRMVQVDVQPYEMCTIDECQLRIRTNEISIWERSHTPTTTTTNEEEEEEEDSNNDHHDRHGHRHRQSSARLVYDPCKVITKYRRSVAGGSSLQGPPRSFTALQTTVQYLIHHIYIPQPQHHQQQPQQTYLSQISFWEDRIRAVQVDLVRSNVTSKLIQQFIVKCYILLLYILSDCHQYEHTFGHTALQTSLSGYWEDCCRIESSSVQRETTCISDAMDDEILSYNICIQLHQQLQILMSTEENIVDGRPHTTTTTTAVQLFWSQCTELYRQVTTTMTTGSNTGTTSTTTTTTLLQRLPFLQWTFRLAFQCMGGYWQSALSMLLQQHLPQPQSQPQPTRDTQQSSGPSSSSLLLQSLYNSNNKSDAMTYSPQDWERFQVLVKCTLAPALPYLRYKVLQAMNVTYMKNEGISITEVARLLCYDHNSSFLECLEFCRRWGLPIHENDEQIRCKVVPIQPFQRMTTDRVRSNDAVILGNNTPYYTSSDDIRVPSPEWMTTMLT